MLHECGDVTSSSSGYIADRASSSSSSLSRQSSRTAAASSVPDSALPSRNRARPSEESCRSDVIESSNGEGSKIHGTIIILYRVQYCIIYIYSCYCTYSSDRSYVATVS